MGNDLPEATPQVDGNKRTGIQVPTTDDRTKYVLPHQGESGLGGVLGSLKLINSPPCSHPGQPELVK